MFIRRYKIEAIQEMAEKWKQEAEQAHGRMMKEGSDPMDMALFSRCVGKVDGALLILYALGLGKKPEGTFATELMGEGEA